MEPFSSPGRLGQLHTPTQSFSEGPSSRTLDATSSKSLTINDKKFKEDTEVVKSRLSDQKFNIRDYPDPLLPRETEKSLPKGLTVETERKLLGLIAKVRSAEA